MRISDWSSDVCSSDLFIVPGVAGWNVNRLWMSSGDIGCMALLVVRIVGSQSPEELGLLVVADGVSQGVVLRALLLRHLGVAQTHGLRFEVVGQHRAMRRALDLLAPQPLHQEPRAVKS